MLFHFNFSLSVRAWSGLMAAALDLMAGAFKIGENPLWRRQNKRKSLMEASGAMDLMAAALDDGKRSQDPLEVGFMGEQP